ncbi:MAG: glycosyltransferase, partial [Pseudomonadota bacterium]
RRVRSAAVESDLIDIHWTYPEAPAGALLAKRWSKPYAMTLRGKEAFYAGMGAAREQQILVAIENAEAVVAVSKELENLASEKVVMKGRSTTIPNGVDLNRFSRGDQGEARRSVNVSETEPMVVSVGFLSERKGFHTLIACWPKVIENVPGARLYIIGDEGAEGSRAYTERLITLIDELDLQDHVFLVGRKSPDELVNWYRAADLFALATAGEGSPNVVLEALATGLPAIVTDVGGVREILAEPHLGEAVDAQSGDWAPALSRALEKRWDKSQICDTMARRTWNECAGKVVSFLESAVGEGQQR